MENNNETKKIGEDDNVILVTCLKCQHQKALTEEETAEFNRKVDVLIEDIERGEETAYCSSEYDHMELGVGCWLTISDEYNEHYQQNECECRLINEDDYNDYSEYEDAIANIEPSELTERINELVFKQEFSNGTIKELEAYKGLTFWSLHDKCAHYAVHEQRPKQREEELQNDNEK